MNERQMQSWAAALRGRRQWTEDQAREVLHRQGASGQNVTRFARRMGFVAQRLHWWRRRLGNASGVDTRSGVGEVALEFVPVVVRGALQVSDVQAPIVVRLCQQVRVEVHQPDATTAAWVALVVAGFANGGSQ
jgi:transposase-like protein